MDADLVARRLAARQDGVIHAEQMLRSGLSRKQVQRRARCGELIRVHPHVFLVAGAALSFRARVRAALLALGPSAFASHRTAAVLWWIRRGEPEVIDVSAPGSGPRRLTGVRVHRITHPVERDIRTRDGLRLSAPARAICEMAAGEARTEVEYAVQEAAARLHMTPEELRGSAQRWGGRPGAGMLRAILQDEGDDEFTRSWAERRLRYILRTARLPLPDHTNVLIAGQRCDAVWDDQRLIIEVDGIGTHGTPVAFLRDRRMSTELTLAGWRVLRFAATELRDAPWAVAVQIGRALLG